MTVLLSPISAMILTNCFSTFGAAKLLQAADAESKAKALFQGADPKNIPLEKFKEVVTKLAGEQNKTFDDLAKQLASEGPKLLESALGAGVSALQGAFSK